MSIFHQIQNYKCFELINNHYNFLTWFSSEQYFANFTQFCRLETWIEHLYLNEILKNPMIYISFQGKKKLNQVHWASTYII